METQGRQIEKLKPTISTLSMVAMAVGAMSGPWMLMMPYWYGVTGPSVHLVLLACVILLTPVCFVYGELTAMLPFAGGEYIFVRHGLGKVSGFIAGWLLLGVYMMALAFNSMAVFWVFQVLVGIESVPTWVLAVCSIGITLVFCILNYFKIAISVRIEFIMAAIMVITGMIIAFMFIGSDHFTVANMKPYFAQGSMGFIICIGAMIMMFCGFDIVPQMAEEGNYPRRKSVWVMVGSVWIMGAIYIIASIGQSGMMPTSWLVKQMVIDPEIAKMHWGVFPWALVLTAALGACLTSLNAFIMAATRVIFGLGRSGVLPPVLGHVNKYGVPDAALLFGFVASALIVGWAGEQWLNYILPGASVYIGVVYGLSAVSLVTLRKKHPKWNRPYTITGGIPMAWIAAIIAFGATIFAATALPAGAWLLTALYLIVGVGIWVYMIMKSGEAYEEVLMTPDDIHPETD